MSSSWDWGWWSSRDSRGGSDLRYEGRLAGNRRGRQSRPLSTLTNRSITSLAGLDSGDALAVASATDGTSQHTSESTLHFGTRAPIGRAPGLEALACYAETVVSNSKQKPLSHDKGSCSLCDHRLVIGGLWTVDLRSETGGPTWRIGEKPRIPCAFALSLMSPLRNS
jgi:hypothetical protein